MKTNLKRVLSLVCALALCIGLLPVSALAAGGQATDYISLSENSGTSTGAEENNILIRVKDSETGEILGETYFSRKHTNNELTISLVSPDVYDIESVDFDRGSVTSEDKSADSYSSVFLALRWETGDSF